ncbi:hypothetical protein CQ054_22475 [Ochrobactrum sp. MYb29]|uniref:hypothetical protein n=1 Tax=Brucella pituitosa TaxID=571256 RepID=UPI000C275D80|nr:hypothetical protein [Brucella pituitosa]PJO49337.1 hypothetical protein CWE02_06065 [Brucella pituitosa]PRA78231.1 hypothetical protein CQ054_22475 [Ochrobactrum sp. MYb29]
MVRITILAMIATLTISTANATSRTCNSPTPVNSIDEMFDALFACWEPPAGTAGLAMTLRFSLRRDGTLIGEPRVTYKGKLNGDERSKAFEASILDALEQALPVPFTKGMAGAIAGRPMALLFQSGGS